MKNVEAPSPNARHVRASSRYRHGIDNHLLWQRAFQRGGQILSQRTLSNKQAIFTKDLRFSGCTHHLNVSL